MRGPLRKVGRLTKEPLVSVAEPFTPQRGGAHERSLFLPGAVQVPCFGALRVRGTSHGENVGIRARRRVKGPVFPASHRRHGKNLAHSCNLAKLSEEFFKEQGSDLGAALDTGGKEIWACHVSLP